MAQTATAPLHEDLGHEVIAATFLGSIARIERVHRALLDLIKNDLDRRGSVDITAVQALLLYNIGDQELAAGELRTRGCYFGTNASYNLKKMVEVGLIKNQRSKSDRRSVRITLTDKGKKVRDHVAALFQRHASIIEQDGGISPRELSALNRTLDRLARFWNEQILYAMQPE